jgi:hypothetical protein
MLTTRQFVLGLIVGGVGVSIAVRLGLFLWVPGAVALGLAIVTVLLLRDDPRARRRGPAVLLVTSVLLGELVCVLTIVGYPFRLWMVAALVLGAILASAMGLFTQGRERRKAAMYVAIGLPVILVLAVGCVRRGRRERRAVLLKGTSIASISRTVGLPQHPDQDRPERPILLAVDQELGEGARLRVPPIGADRVGAVESDSGAPRSLKHPGHHRSIRPSVPRPTGAPGRSPRIHVPGGRERPAGETKSSSPC